MRSSADLVVVAVLALLAGVITPARCQDTDDARPLIVIDAGHGGVDPGAIGPRGTREKTVTLAVAKDLAGILRQATDYEVRMTRTRDTLIALRDRPRMANRWRQDGGRPDRPALFISIHCNANKNASVRGFETYFLSEAKTEDARRVEAMENAAQQYEDDDHEVDPVDFILHDLRQNLYLRDSNRFAENVQAHLDDAADGPDRGVKQAGFAVLNGAFMPAVLAEIGFITNRGEEARLTDGAVQHRIARQLALSIESFFDKRADR